MAGTLVFDPGLGERRPGSPSGRGGDFPPAPAPVDTALPPPVSNARLATLVFIVFESMLFAGLLGGYTVER